MYPCTENHNRLDLLACLEDANEMHIDPNIFPQIYNANGIEASTRENCDIPSPFYLIFDVPTFLPMTSRAQPRGEIR